ncbi:hypothetical protein FOL47_000792 [Perkinsus chesapeaki]|uniref:Uncharacterized protein n=1 Tax=Perkinsus chesapeaki TaxID=330153 RepID=A0A7J6MKT9_PERCH|nr:hypothetical protein FOL47_000792 [Perkinsus chesapeaki]
MTSFSPAGASGVTEGAVLIPQPSARDIVNQSIILRRSISHTGLPPGTFGPKMAQRRVTEHKETESRPYRSRKSLSKDPHSGAVDHLLYLIEPPVTARSVEEFRLQFGVLLDTLRELEMRDEDRSQALRECNRLKARLKGETLYRKELGAAREGLCEEVQSLQDDDLKKVEDAIQSATESNERLRESIRKTDAEIGKTQKIDESYRRRAAELYKEIKRLVDNGDSDVASASGVTSRSMSSEKSSEPPRMSIISNMLLDADGDSTDGQSSDYSASEISLELAPRKVEVVNL